MSRKMKLFAAIAAALWSLGLGSANAQSPAYPSKPITLVIPFGPGGSVDQVARVLKPRLEERLRQPILLDFRPGSATIVGTGIVSQAPADGYTLGFVVDAFTINPSLYNQLPYDTLTGLAPVTQTGMIPLVVAVNSESKLKTLKDLVSKAKANPGALSFGTVGTGSINHLAAELFSRVAGIKMTHASYKGGGPAVTDLLGGHIDLMLMSVTLASAQLEAGKFRALAVTSEQRVPALPDVPTVAENGYPGFKAFAWQGVIAPAKTPPEIVARVQKEFKAVLDLPDVRKALMPFGFNVIASTPAEFAAFIKADVATWTKVVKDANIKAEN
jgi:tripartite-type tricarboxylate transporter receptor subunit TctC